MLIIYGFFRIVIDTYNLYAKEKYTSSCSIITSMVLKRTFHENLHLSFYETCIQDCLNPFHELSYSMNHPDRAPLKEVLGGQYREGGRQVLRQGA